MSIDWTKHPSFEEIINDKEFQSAFSKMHTESYINDEKTLFIKLKKELNLLNELINRLKATGIDLTLSNWYKDLDEIYIPEAIQHFNKVFDETRNIDIITEDKLWMRKNSDSLFSTIEKFTKFIVLEIFGKKCKKWNDAIIKLDDIKTIQSIKNVAPNNEDELNKILNYVCFTLDSWRQLYNSNKHDINKEKNNIVENQQEKSMIVCANDVLDFIHEFVHIINLLLPFLLIIKTKK